MSRKRETLQVLEELAVEAGLTFHCRKTAGSLYQTWFRTEILGQDENGIAVHIDKPDGSLIYRLHPQPEGDLCLLTLENWANEAVIVVGEGQQPKYNVVIMNRQTGGYDPSNISHEEYDLMIARLAGEGKYQPPNGSLANIR